MRKHGESLCAAMILKPVSAMLFLPKEIAKIAESFLVKKTFAPCFRLNFEFSDCSENPLLARIFLMESTAKKLQGLESRKLNSEEMCLSIF